ncbi:hypothetical protein QR680_005860 [Steinernema hermaphroditum]|uniref:DnaJ homolog subfamily B member 9 n=1 Tax=Steinernema hermaphroditum TaxID=289476 RepID=A0AA39LW57_9BILA|nr:hypothetical protein QR680_005860 [Steinernema hermaphroditum]
MSTIGFFGRRCFSNSATLLRPRATLYDTLGVKPIATERQIKDAYYRLATEHHPDKTGASHGSPEALKFVEISDAYEVLRDKRKRREYDSHVFVVAPSKPWRGREMGDVELTRGFMAGGFSGTWCFDRTFKCGDEEYRSYEEYEKAEERRKNADFDRMAKKYLYAIRVFQILVGAWVLNAVLRLAIGLHTKALTYSLLGMDWTKRVNETRISKDPIEDYTNFQSLSYLCSVAFLFGFLGAFFLFGLMIGLLIVFGWVGLLYYIHLVNEEKQKKQKEK